MLTFLLQLPYVYFTLTLQFEYFNDFIALMSIIIILYMILKLSQRGQSSPFKLVPLLF